MNNDQITALAREYAEFTDLSPVDKKNVSVICENFLKYTLRRNCASRYVFDKIFDRAYALGKETETITQEEIEKAAEEFADKIRIPASIPGVMVPFINGIAHDAYLQGAQDCLGKQESKQETVIQGWAARDGDENLFMYSVKPERNEALQVWMGRCADCDLCNSLLPNLTWDSDPIKVELIITRKKNG